jgi:hypothetical protein
MPDRHIAPDLGPDGVSDKEILDEALADMLPEERAALLAEDGSR